MSVDLEALYKKMTQIIDKAEESQNIYLVPDAAEACGMTGGEIEAGLTQKWEYALLNEAGDSVKVHCRWYDQSKPFSIQPDKHIMTVSIEVEGQKRSHTKAYES